MKKKRGAWRWWHGPMDQYVFIWFVFQYSLLEMAYGDKRGVGELVEISLC